MSDRPGRPACGGPAISTTEIQRMNFPAVKTEPSVPLPTTTAKVFAFEPPSRAPLRTRAVAFLGQLSARIVPPLVVIALLLLIWELLCRKAGLAVPPASKVIASSWELIAHPFYDRGGLDKGLFWHLSASLQRVRRGNRPRAMSAAALGPRAGRR